MTVEMRRAIYELKGDRAAFRALAGQISMSREDLADFAELPDFKIPEASMAALEEWWPVHHLRLILRDPTRTSYIGDICAATGIDRTAYDGFVDGEQGLSRADRDKLRAFALGHYGMTWDGLFVPPAPNTDVVTMPQTSAEMPEGIRRMSALINEIRKFPLHTVEELVSHLRQARS